LLFHFGPGRRRGIGSGFKVTAEIKVLPPCCEVDSLKAVVLTPYGLPTDVLQLREVAAPEPAADEALIRLYASSVNPLDDFTFKGPLFFLPK
jgi:hypothetical protein